MHVRTFQAILPLLALLAVGCEAPMPKPADLERGSLAYVRDGSLTREQAILKLGEPTGRFEQDRILTWLLRADEKGAVTSLAREQVAETVTIYCRIAQYSLVMVFDGPVLARHSLVSLSYDPVPGR